MNSVNQMPVTELPQAMTLLQLTVNHDEIAKLVSDVVGEAQNVGMHLFQEVVHEYSNVVPVARVFERPEGGIFRPIWILDPPGPKTGFY